jgi:glycosyltransferase involved in cell wall biosynthesis
MNSKNEQVVFLMPSIGYGGCEAYSIRLALEFKKNYDVVFVLSNQNENHLFESHLIENNFKIVWLKYDFSGDSLKFISLFLKKLFHLCFILKKLSPKYIHINLAYPTMGFIMLIVTSLSFSKTVVCFHCVPDDIVINKFRKIIFKQFISKKINIVVQTNVKKQILANGFNIDSSKIYVIENGINIEGYQFQKKMYNLNNSSLLKFISIGRLSFEKGHHLLLDQLSSLRNINYCLDIFGSGPLHLSLTQKIQYLNLTNTVFLKGYINYIPQVLRDYDFLLLSSIHESYPTVIIESMAKGVIVISSRFTGVNEIISDEHDGFLFDIHNPQSFYLLIESIVNKEYDLNKISENARVKAESLSIENVYNKTLQVISD